MIENVLVGQGMVRGGGAAQYGGFLGMLASIGIPLAIDLVKKVLGKGMHVRSRRSVPPPPPPPPTRRVGKGKGLHVGPPPVWGSWADYEKKHWR